MLKNFQVYKTM